MQTKYALKSGMHKYWTISLVYWLILHDTFLSIFIFISFLAIAAHWTQRAWLGIQGVLQASGHRRGLERAYGQKALLCSEEHPNICPLRYQDPGTEQPRLGTWTHSGDWILWGGP